MVSKLPPDKRGTPETFSKFGLHSVVRGTAMQHTVACCIIVTHKSVISFLSINEVVASRVVIFVISGVAGHVCGWVKTAKTIRANEELIWTHC